MSLILTLGELETLPPEIQVNLQVDQSKPVIESVSGIAFNFDNVTSDADASRADEIKVLLVKNKKPSRKSKERKPGGYGLPTGQLESKEDVIHALERETRDESGHEVINVVGRLFTVFKKHINNIMQIFLIEVSDWPDSIKEKDEIDVLADPWLTLRQAFKMPTAQDRDGQNQNPNGIYFSHRQRLYWAIESMVFDPENLIDTKNIQKWVEPHRQTFIDAMIDLERAGLLKDFLASETDKY